MALPYNISDVLTGIDTVITTNGFTVLSSNASQWPTVLFGLITPCQEIKVDNVCSRITFEDKTDWSSLLALGTVELSAVLVYRSESGDVSPCSGSIILNLNGSLSWDVPFEDGQYCVIVSVTFDETGNSLPITETYEECIVLTCCTSKKDKIIWCATEKIAKVSALICKYTCIGRDTTKLYETLFSLQNIKFALQTCCLTCQDIEDLSCAFNSIKGV